MATSCDIVDVLAKLRVSPEPHADNCDNDQTKVDNESKVDYPTKFANNQTKDDNQTKVDNPIEVDNEQTKVDNPTEVDNESKVVIDLTEVDNGPKAGNESKVVFSPIEDFQNKDDLSGSSVASKKVENEANLEESETEKLPSHRRQTAEALEQARTLSEAVFAAFGQPLDRPLEQTPSDTLNQTSDLPATPSKASTLPMPPPESPSRSIPEIIEATRARNTVVRQMYDRAQARSRLPPPVTVSDILDFKKSLAEKTGIVYVGEEALAETILAPSKAYINEGNTQIRVFKTHPDIEREDQLDKYKLEIEEQVKNDFKQLIASKKPPVSDKPNFPPPKASFVIPAKSELEPVARASSPAEGSTSKTVTVDSEQDPAKAASKPQTVEEKSSAESKTVADNQKKTSYTPIVRSGPFVTRPAPKTDPVDFISDLKSLSRSHKFTSGKWLISVPWNEVDNAWNIIKTEFINDNLTEEARYIKVYGRQDNEENPHFRRSASGGRYSYNAMISIMTNDWTDEAKTMDVAKKIRAAGVKAVLRYKPDISTTLEIYCGNSLRAKPTVYTLEN